MTLQELIDLNLAIYAPNPLTENHVISINKNIDAPNVPANIETIFVKGNPISLVDSKFNANIRYVELSKFEYSKEEVLSAKCENTN